MKSPSMNHDEIIRAGHPAPPGPRSPGINSQAPSASGRSSGSRFARGTTQRRKPSWLASLTRSAACGMPRISPASPISPKTAVASATGRFRRLDATAAATLRSAAGSSSRIPPATLTKTSSPMRFRPSALLEDGQQQRQPRLIDARRHAPRIAKRARAHERLHFDKQRPRSLDRAMHGRPGRVRGTLREEQRRGIRHRHQPLAGHLEDAKLARGAESVLHGAHNSMRMMPLALEIRAPCRQRARAPSVRQGCHPWSRGRRRRREHSGSWRRTGFASRPHAPGRCCPAPTASSARRSSESNRR